MSIGLPEWGKVRVAAIYLFIFIICIYFLSLSNILVRDQFIQRTQVTQSIVEKFQISIPQCDDSIKGTDGRSYSLYGLGWPILAVPFYVVGKHIGNKPDNLMLLINPLAGAATATLVFLFSIALGYSQRSSLVVAILYGMGTIAWPLATHPFDHTLETLFVLLSVFYMYLHSLTNDRIKIVLSAIFFGFAMNTRLVSLLALPAVMLIMGSSCGEIRNLPDYGKTLLRKGVMFFLALLPFAGLVLWYNYCRFGSIFETGFQLLSERTGLDFFSGTPLTTGLAGFIASPGKGYFYYSPVALLFFFAIIPFYKKHRWPAFAFILSILFYLLFLSKNIYWHGDWAWGPRYLLPVTPYMVLPVGEFLDSDLWRRKIPRILVPFCLLVSLGILIQLAAISVHFQVYFFDLQINRHVRFERIEKEGVPAITEPPPEVYFDWTYSPILAQMKSIKRIGSNMWNYRNVEPPQGATDLERVKGHPSMQLFDYWWLIMYFVNQNHLGLIVLPLFLIGSGICGVQLLKMTRRETSQ